MQKFLLTINLKLTIVKSDDFSSVWEKWGGTPVFLTIVIILIVSEETDTTI